MDRWNFIEPANYYTAGDSRTRGNHRLRQIRAKKDTYQHSFFPRSIREWNQVPSSVVDAGSLEDFHPLAFITTQINDMIFICICHPSLWTFTCFGGAPCLIVYAPESHTLTFNYSPTRIREEEEELIPILVGFRNMYCEGGHESMMTFQMS